MSNQPNKLSLEKITWYLLLLLLVLVLLYAGRTLFVPMFYGLFIAIILYPLCRWLENKGFKISIYWCRSANSGNPAMCIGWFINYGG